MVEVWKKVNVEGYERYSISSIEEVRNDDRKRIMKNNLSNTEGIIVFNIQSLNTKKGRFILEPIVK